MLKGKEKYIYVHAGGWNKIDQAQLSKKQKTITKIGITLKKSGKNDRMPQVMDPGERVERKPFSSLICR